ncbi:Phosphate metabolism transcription protein [Ascosphaera atra]|nr:Phosphate metabolism transcription protein [Ascosphaera atra]
MNLTDSARADALQKSIADLQRVIKEDELQPVLRTTYNRTAFQIPGDDRVRVSLDTDLAFIREDALDQDRPCRDPEDWHRQDIDNRHMNFPFSEIRQGEISRFPHALLEIRIRDDAKKGSKELLSDLLNSHLVKESPRFSKFVHGVAELFEDYVNSFPFWLSDLDTDIRRDPEDVDANDERERKRNEDHFAVGSFIGSLRDNYRPPGSSHAAAFDESRRIFRSRESVVLSKADAERLRKQSIGQDSAISDQGEAIPSPRFAPTTTTVAAFGAGELNAPANERQVDTGIEDRRTTIAPFAGLRTYFARLRARRRDDSAPLPPGVQVPGTWIKDAGPLRVEAKVWLANQRTFIKWQHIAVLLASLSVGLYNAAMTRNDQLATVLALVYVSFAVFAGAWGYSVYLWRSNLIRKRSGKDFDNVAGPMIVCLGLAIALLMNFWLKYSEYQRARENKPGSDPLPVPDKPIWAFNASGHVSGPVEDDFMLVNQAVN